MAKIETSRAEDDAILVRWAGTDDSGRRLAQFTMFSAGPDDWHAVASTWNWDSGLEPLCWIIRRPECDKATALQIFWLSCPDYYLKFAGDVSRIPSFAIQEFLLSTEILQRWMTGFYNRAEIAYDPGAFVVNEIVGRQGALEDTPVSMKGPLNGRDVITDQYAEGIPSFLWQPGELT